MDINKYITSDSAVCHGKPCFKGTRIMVHTILELLSTGVAPEEIVSDKYYPELTREHIQAALKYAAVVAEGGEIFEIASS